MPARSCTVSYRPARRAVGAHRRQRRQRRCGRCSRRPRRDGAALRHARGRLRRRRSSTPRRARRSTTWSRCSASSACAAGSPTGEVELSRAPGSPGEITVPAGTRVATADGRVEYETTATATMRRPRPRSGRRARPRAQRPAAGRQPHPAAEADRRHRGCPQPRADVDRRAATRRTTSCAPAPRASSTAASGRPAARSST